jgi:hypothetical protein
MQLIEPNGDIRLYNFFHIHPPKIQLDDFICITPLTRFGPKLCSFFFFDFCAEKKCSFLLTKMTQKMTQKMTHPPPSDFSSSSLL